jgi:hypothetical protein
MPDRPCPRANVQVPWTDESLYVETSRTKKIPHTDYPSFYNVITEEKPDNNRYIRDPE